VGREERGSTSHWFPLEMTENLATVRVLSARIGNAGAARGVWSCGIKSLNIQRGRARARVVRESKSHTGACVTPLPTARENRVDGEGEKASRCCLADSAASAARNTKSRLRSRSIPTRDSRLAVSCFSAPFPEIFPDRRGWLREEVAGRRREGKGGRGNDRASLCRSQAAYRHRRNDDGEVLMAARRAAGAK